ncbi:MAG: hypothetical protein K5925_04045 [Bacilli bacterium]|nr:hypothetical protein [Bacilli bacterium]
MKLKKLFLFTSIIPLLTSCNTSDISGMYSFQLGKDTSTHIGVFLEMKNTEYVFEKEPDKKGYKDFTLSVSMKINDDEESDFRKEIEEILKALADEKGNTSLPGYYKYTDEQNKQGENRVIIGFDYGTIANKAITYYNTTVPAEEQIDPADIDDMVKSIENNGAINALLYATYKDSVMNIYVPVSLEDAYYQVYWYGYDIQVKLDFELPIPIDFKIVEVEKHPFGSHPTEDEVKAINETFAEKHEGMLIEAFRDYNALKLGLNKKQ